MALKMAKIKGAGITGLAVFQKSSYKQPSFGINDDK